MELVGVWNISALVVVFDDQYNKVHTFPVLVTQRG
jgi:hypothetical protein